MRQDITFGDLLERLRGLLDAHQRSFVAIMGAPGSGKSTLAEDLLIDLQTTAPGAAAILPMDGFHYDDGLLAERGRLAHKGAPDTFDAEGLGACLHRLAACAGPVAVPVFDRALEISRAGARIIEADTRLLLVEGNYLLLNDPRWQESLPRFDLTVYLEVPEEVLRARLMARWSDLPLSEATRKVEDNDLPNARRVMQDSRPADLILRSL